MLWSQPLPGAIVKHFAAQGVCVVLIHLWPQILIRISAAFDLDNVRNDATT
jgi:hypothetical protein